MLTLNKVTVQFKQKTALNQLSCTIEQGDFIVILGTNGAGKSTLFDTIAGKVKPTKGGIFLDGQDITQLGEAQRSSMVTRLFQSTQMNSVGSLSVEQNLALAHYSRRAVRLRDGMKMMPREKAIRLVNEIGMDEALLDRPMSALSGGQRQLISFVMATQIIPKILLLDEPTAALDPMAATKLLTHATKFIKQHGITTLLITHDPHIALSIGNKIWVIENGTISKQYTADQKASLRPDDLIGHINYELLGKTYAM